ncbi:MAG TPA: hypothetical protein VMG37_17140 [Solirubrobacteraceae bacterium]|nr:hypothetical protein [Solirubrobacteraceae bacterium]
MAELRGLFADVDPVPPMVLETAEASLGWRRPAVALDELLIRLAQAPLKLS